MREIVLFATGSPLLADYEATCERLGIAIQAYVKNHDGPDYAAMVEKIVPIDCLPAGLVSKPVICALFTPANRKSAIGAAEACGFADFPALVDPTAVLASSLKMGRGVYVNAGATIGGAGQIGNFVLVNRHASLGHHVEIHDYASVGPGVVGGGQIEIGRGAVICTGATLYPKVRIGANAVVAGGAVVTADVPANTLVAGHPVEILKRDIAGYNRAGV